MDERTDGAGARPVVFGSASLLTEDASPAAARAVLDAAVDAGAARLDVAPMYGYGATEALVLRAGRELGVPVTTKVGIEARPRPARWRRMAVSTVAALPPGAARAVRRLAGAPSVDPHAPSGRFGLDVVRSSVERSLRRSGGPLDRLLLHEVQPPDVTDELLDLLTGYRERGDVVRLGCATRNGITAEVLARGRGAFTVAHVSTAPFGDPVPPVPDGVLIVGHGAFGPGGRDLRRLRRSAAFEREWSATTAGTAFAGEHGLVRALLARGWAQGVDELLVATTRVGRAADLVAAARSALETDPAVTEALARAVGRIRRDEREGAAHVR